MWRHEAWNLNEVSASAQRVPRPIGESRRIGVARHAGRHALRALEDAARAGEAVGAPGRPRVEPGRGGVRGVQLLGVGRLAQELPQPGRLRAGRAERVQHLLGRQPQQLAHRRRRGQRAGGAGGVEDLVVRAAEELADADADLVAGHRGREQLAARAPQRLRHRQRRRKHHRGRMEHRAVVHVVLLGHVRRRGVDRIAATSGLRAAAVDQDLARAVGRAHALA